VRVGRIPAGVGHDAPGGASAPAVGMKEMLMATRAGGGGGDAGPRHSGPEKAAAGLQVAVSIDVHSHDDCGFLVPDEEQEGCHGARHGESRRMCDSGTSGFRACSLAGLGCSLANKSAKAVKS